MPSLNRVLTYALSTPWAIKQEVGNAALWVLWRRAYRGRLAPDEVADIVGEDRARVEARHAANAASSRGGVAIVPVYGVIQHRAHTVANMSGGGATATESVAKSLRAALGDERVSTVILDIDSPGGDVFGVEELAGEIRGASKPVVAVANAMAASAAYWLATQANELIVTPSGEVGSIGVYAMHEDWSRAWENEGVVGTFVYAGANKVEGNHLEPLSEEARGEMQRRVNDYYSSFVGAVAKGRGVSRSTVESDFGQGRMFGAKDAVARGMADRVATLDETIARLQGGGRVRRRRAAEGGVMIEIATDPPTPAAFVEASASALADDAEAYQCSDCGYAAAAATAEHIDALIERHECPEAGTDDPPVTDIDLRERRLELLTASRAANSAN